MCYVAGHIRNWPRIHSRSDPEKRIPGFINVSHHSRTLLRWQYSRRTMLRKLLLPLRRRVTQSAIALKASFVRPEVCWQQQYRSSPVFTHPDPPVVVPTDCETHNRSGTSPISPRVHDCKAESTREKFRS